MENGNIDNLKDLKQIVGDEAFDVIICRFGGTRLYIPSKGWILLRNQKIVEEYDEYLACHVISTTALEHLAKKHGLSTGQIRKIIKNYHRSAN